MTELKGGCSMYRIMIVDDELIIREGISTFIDWEGLDCQIAHSASDGWKLSNFSRQPVWIL